MKLINIKRCICLLIITAFALTLSVSLSASAVRYEGGTEVIAHIDPASKTQPTTVGEDNLKPQDNSNVLTGKEISIYSIIAIVILLASAVIIYICINRRKSE